MSTPANIHSQQAVGYKTSALGSLQVFIFSSVFCLGFIQV